MSLSADERKAVVDFRIEKARRAFIHLFGQHFVQPGIVDVKDGKFYNATGAEVK